MSSKISNKSIEKSFSPFYKEIFSFFIITLFSSYIFADSQNTEIKLPPMDGVRHSGTKEVFDRIVTDHKAKPYKVTRDNMNGRCMNTLNDLRNGIATYFEPKIMTDDYEDVRLAPFKEKYRQAVKSVKNEDWASYPWSGWLGGGVDDLGRLTRPTRNFLLYELDIDGDHVDEVIFHGDMNIQETFDNDGHVMKTDIVGGCDYHIYKNNTLDNLLSCPEPYDFQNKKYTNNYSSLVLIKDQLYLINSNISDDFVLTRFYAIGNKTIKNSKKVPLSINCEFSTK